MVTGYLRVEIEREYDRDKMVVAIANNGRKVWVEKDEDYLRRMHYFVCFDVVEDSTVKTGE